jgi:hypothetical protein
MQFVTGYVMWLFRMIVKKNRTPAFADSQSV